MRGERSSKDTYRFRNQILDRGVWVACCGSSTSERVLGGGFFVRAMFRSVVLWVSAAALGSVYSLATVRTRSALSALTRLSAVQKQRATPSTCAHRDTLSVSCLLPIEPLVFYRVSLER